MAKYQKTSQRKQGEGDQRRRTRKKQTKPLFDHLLTGAQDASSITETPFRPQMDTHATLLANARSNAQRANLIMRLQEAYGNKYVQRLLNSRASQAKLTVSQPDDAYEQEADRVANMVTQKTSTADIQRQREKEEELQTKPTAISEGLEKRINTVRGSGQPLSDTIREPMEQAFGIDFSDVRVHTDSQANEMNQQLNSKAFTTGQDVFFREGEYNPEDPSGQEMLAHELTHTQQQGSSERIAGWWPKGHRLITEKALDDLREVYSKRAQNYLIDRSPDMDFKMDGFRTMRKGQKDSEKKLKEYRKNLASEDEFQKALARTWYDENDLHIREQSYMDNHGEGGYYKEPGEGKNAGVTTDLVSKAVAKWNSGNPLQSLSVLSDALHQAEDRGSHGEGNPFDGHDVRLTLNKEPWEKLNYKGDWEPDNIAVNSKGAVLAIAHAKKLLNDFKNTVNLKKGKKISFSAIKKFFKPKRRLWMGYIWPVKSGDLSSRFIGKTGVGKKKFKKLVAEKLKDQSIKDTYEKARKKGDVAAEDEALNQELRLSVEDPDYNMPLMDDLEALVEEGGRLKAEETEESAT